MTDSYRALCSDFYVNQKLGVKMDLPTSRETLLDLFERIRRDFPEMDQFRRYDEELALETPQESKPQRWLAVRSASIRSGVVNPDDDEAAYGLHRRVLEVAPYFLSISPLDIDYVELLVGFDLSARGNHDEIVFDAILNESPLGGLLEIDGAAPTECQPLFGVSYGAKREFEAHVELKTRSDRSPAFDPLADPGAEPISLYLTVRRFGAVDDLKALPGVLRSISDDAERIVTDQVAPRLLKPLRDAITGHGV